MEYPSFGKRFLAWFIDNFILGIALFILLLVFGGAIGLTADLENGAAGPMSAVGTPVLMLLAVALQFVYYGYFWSKDGQSLGKRAMGISVVGRDGGLLSFASAGLRGTFGYWISAMVFYLGFLWALFDENNETWHDKLFNSEVVVD